MKNRIIKTIGVIVAAVLILGAVLAFLYVPALDHEIQSRFNGKRWSVPATVYARPLELYPGLTLSPDMLEQELALCGYRKLSHPTSSGSYSRDGSSFSIITRDFHYPSGLEKSVHIRVKIAQNEVASITDAEFGGPLPLIRLDPARIGSFHPVVHEDRILVTRDEIPQMLIKTLIAVEDKNFFDHHGIAPLGIARALLVNLRAGKTVQGGSTLTQQLVKNLFLTNERSIARKIREAVMALLLEYHYSKDEILTAYVNEVFLGQDSNRAIHGFALASLFYFRKDLNDLEPQEIATLVGMVKGPSLYNPEKNPTACTARRNTVLAIMASESIFEPDRLQELQQTVLLDGELQKGGFNRFPAFLDVVRQQLGGEYKEEDLKTNGLKIFTTLDPQIQFAAEKNLTATINDLEQEKSIEKLQGAAVIVSRETGEILAVVGDRDPLAHGFNRAVNAKRPIGSLVKPAVYLTGLNTGYTLDSPILDTAITMNEPGQKAWQPENYDKREHGDVPLYFALANSYNLATVRLGLDLGVDKVVTTLHDLGLQEDIKPFPSLLLGAIDLSPLEVSQLYQTIASGGFYSPLRAINSVMAADNSLLTRYGVEVEQRFSPAVSFLLTHAMQRVASEGTARSLLNSPLGRLMIAGKTGTSDQLRDSWFAGFTGNHLALVWMGKDDNSTTKLSGSSGALRGWTRIMENIPNDQLTPAEPPGIIWQQVETVQREESTLGRGATTVLPFIIDTEPYPEQPSLTTPVPQVRKKEGFFDKLNRLFQ